MRKLLSWTAILAASVYVLGLGALSACQRSMMYFPTADVVAPTLPGVEAVRIDTSDGEHLVAWYAAPARGQPVFLYFDGNGGRPEMWDLRWRAITDHGAGFLAVYYRGYSGSTGHPTEQGLHRDA